MVYSQFLCVLIIQLLFGKLANSLDDCNPFTECKKYFAGLKVADPANCHNYYVCVEDANGNVVPSSYPTTCPPGFYFYAYSRSCEAGSCTDNCLNICPVECTTYQNERIDDSTNCSSFYICIPGNLKIKSECPPELPYFDGNACSPNSLSCCDSCVPFCYSHYFQVRDPYDCRKFYYCATLGIPADTYRYSCPDGQYFNTVIGRCIIENPGDPCVSTCASEQ